MTTTECNIRGCRATADSGRTVPVEHVYHTLSQTNRAECIALAAQLGIVRRVRTRTDAVEAIVRWVLERPLAIQSIQY